MSGPRRRHGHLFWRVYLHGLTLLVVVGLAVAAVGWALRSEGNWHQTERVAEYAAGRLAELAPEPARLEAELRRVREAFGVDATVYAVDGRVLATTVDPPLETRTPGAGLRRSGSARLRGGGFGYAVRLPASAGRLVLAGDDRGEHLPRGLLFIGTVLLALAAGSYPFARSIASPVERLTAASRALGAGDLSARANVRARGELGELGRAFDDMAARLAALVQGERELLANVSHELRTPLARIRVALELAAEGDHERARRFLGEIGQDLSELDRLIDDVLEAARLDARGAGAWPAARAPLELAAVVRDAAERFREAHPGRALSVELAAAPPSFAGDAPLLRRLLAILLDNAAKYSQPPAPVALALRTEGTSVLLEVRDRGIGIDAADLPHLFTPFFRTDRSRARGTGGTGLGLALARRIAEAHGGTIEAESAPGAETVFRVRLPAARAEAGAPPGRDG